MFKIKLPSSVKAILLFVFIGLSIYLLYRKGLLSNNQLYIFNSGFRIPQLIQFSKGLELTHEPLLGYRDNVTPNYYPVENLGDDMGIYYFVPLIQHLFHTSTTYSAYLMLFCGIILTGYSLAVIGISLLFENMYIKYVSYFYLALFALFNIFILDVYVFAYLVTSLIPLLFWIWKKYSTGQIKIIYPIIALLITGFLAGTANQFRAYSGVGVIIAVILFVFFERKISIVRKLIFVGALLVTMPVCKLYLSGQINQRNEWISEHNNCALINKGSGHVFWHSLYTGLGFVKNKYGIEWDDNVSFEKKKQLNPSLYNITGEYEAAMKNEYMTLVKSDLFFVLKTYAYKFFFILLLSLVFFNYGIFLIKRCKFNYRTLVPFLAGILFYALPGILVYPLPIYVIGALNMLVIGEVFLVNEVYAANNIYVK